GAVFAVGSRFNHSCTPNVSKVWVDRKKKVSERFTAARDIEAGEELTIHYCDIRAERSFRRTKLEGSYHFTCTCPDCMLEGDERKASDEARERMAHLTGELPNMARAAFKGVDAARELLALHETHLHALPVYVRQAAYQGFEMALYKRDIAEARGFIYRVLANQILMEGDGHHCTEWRKYCEDPSTHRIAQAQGLKSVKKPFEMPPYESMVEIKPAVESLQCLDVSYNNLTSLSTLRNLTHNTALHTLSLTGNGLTSCKRYRTMVNTILPSLCVLDSLVLRRGGRGYKYSLDSVSRTPGVVRGLPEPKSPAYPGVDSVRRMREKYTEKEREAERERTTERGLEAMRQIHSLSPSSASQSLVLSASDHALSPVVRMALGASVVAPPAAHTESAVVSDTVGEGERGDACMHESEEEDDGASFMTATGDGSVGRDHTPEGGEEHDLSIIVEETHPSDATGAEGKGADVDASDEESGVEVSEDDGTGFVVLLESGEKAGEGESAAVPPETEDVPSSISAQPTTVEGEEVETPVATPSPPEVYADAGECTTPLTNRDASVIHVARDAGFGGRGTVQGESTASGRDPTPETGGEGESGSPRRDRFVLKRVSSSSEAYPDISTLLRPMLPCAPGTGSSGDKTPEPEERAPIPTPEHRERQRERERGTGSDQLGGTSVMAELRSVSSLISHMREREGKAEGVAERGQTGVKQELGQVGHLLDHIMAQMQEQERERERERAKGKERSTITYKQPPLDIHELGSSSAVASTKRERRGGKRVRRSLVMKTDPSQRKVVGLGGEREVPQGGGGSAPAPMSERRIRQRVLLTPQPASALLQPTLRPVRQGEGERGRERELQGVRRGSASGGPSQSLRVMEEMVERERERALLRGREREMQRQRERQQGSAAVDPDDLDDMIQREEAELDSLSQTQARIHVQGQGERERERPRAHREEPEGMKARTSRPPSATRRGARTPVRSMRDRGRAPAKQSLHRKPDLGCNFHSTTTRPGHKRFRSASSVRSGQRRASVTRPGPTPSSHGSGSYGSGSARARPVARRATSQQRGGRERVRERERDVQRIISGSSRVGRERERSGPRRERERVVSKAPEMDSLRKLLTAQSHSVVRPGGPGTMRTTRSHPQNEWETMTTEEARLEREDSGVRPVQREETLYADAIDDNSYSRSHSRTVSVELSEEERERDDVVPQTSSKPAGSVIGTGRERNTAPKASTKQKDYPMMSLYALDTLDALRAGNASMSAQLKAVKAQTGSLQHRERSLVKQRDELMEALAEGEAEDGAGTTDPTLGVANIVPVSPSVSASGDDTSEDPAPIPMPPRERSRHTLLGDRQREKSRSGSRHTLLGEDQDVYHSCVQLPYTPSSVSEGFPE
ncbi:hypothetical protein KIPB_004133, partial [Kipferlia bialata]